MITIERLLAEGSDWHQKKKNGMSAQPSNSGNCPTTSYVAWNVQ